MAIYMKYPGVSGATENTGHTNWIEINSFQWGVGRGISNTGSSSADREGSVQSVSEIVVTKKSDTTSPNLFHAALGHARLGISIIFTKAPKTKAPYYKLDLKDAVITNIQPHRTHSGKGEKLIISFREYEFNGLKNIPVPYELARS